MPETALEKQLEELFLIEQQLHILLNNEQYELFQEQQNILSIKTKAIITNNSPATLFKIKHQLRELEDKIALLHTKASVSFELLKNKSLQQRRNKNRLKAYK